MAVPLYGCIAHGPYIVQLDDELVVKDLAAEAGTGGNAFTPRMLSAPFEAAESQYSKLRRVTQTVNVGGDATVTLTPYRDGDEAGPAIERSLVAGDDPLVDAPFNTLATAHQVEIELSDFTAAVELGKSRQWVIPRRSGR